MALSRDARLIARVRRGDSSAFEALHARHQPAILAFCRHLTGNREDAEDAVQHTFLAAYRRIVESEDALELRPWLFTVARNRSLSLLRARRERIPGDPDAAAASFDGLSAEVERRQDLRDLVRDMSRLPEPQRAALVLSQLDALSYREIGSVLEVPAEKVKALVFQARSSLASTREAREAPCFEIRSEIANARGSSLRRRLLRRHVGQCDGCREFEVTMLRQRRELAILLPVAPSAGLGQGVLEGVLGREGAATAGTGGAVAATGGAGGAGLAGTLAVLGAGGAAKLAVVAAVVGGVTAGAVAADLPDRIQPNAAIGGSGQTDAGSEEGAPRTAVEDGAGGEADDTRPSPAGRDQRWQADDPSGENRPSRSAETETATRAGESGTGDPTADAEAGEPDTSDRGDAPAPGDDPSALPPGLAKRDELPPGLAKRDELPPGLAKGRDGGPPGNGRGQEQGNGNGSGGGGNAGAAPGHGNGNGGGQGNGNAGGGNPGGGQGGGIPPGLAGEEPGNSGTGNGGGQGNPGAGQGGGNGGGNAGGQGNGNAGGGNPGGGQGNGNPH